MSSVSSVYHADYLMILRKIKILQKEKHGKCPKNDETLTQQGSNSESPSLPALPLCPSLDTVHPLRGGFTRVPIEKKKKDRRTATLDAWSVWLPTRTFTVTLPAVASALLISRTLPHLKLRSVA